MVRHPRTVIIHSMRPAAEPASESPHLPLLAPGDPPPFTVANREGPAPFLLVCDHASNAIPRALGSLGLDAAALERHIAWDIGADALARRLAQCFDAPAVIAGYSRLVIDNNRALDDPSSILATSDGVVIPGNLEVTATQRERRMHSIFEPYHQAIAARLDEFRRRAIMPAFLSIHSFTPVMNDEPRPWQVGVLWDRDPRIAVPLLERLQAIEGLCVGDNMPYSGRHPSDYTVARHAERAGLPHVCIEVRQDLIDHPAGAERWADILASVLTPILADPHLHRGWRTQNSA
jgi:predicted N-formylglutamate amidohydrolase